MFKNITLYKIGELADLQTIESALTSAPYTPCAPTQERSCGWIAPRGQLHDTLVESIGGQWLMRWLCETRQVPASALQAKVDEMAEKILQECGLIPGKRELRDLKDKARLEMLPHAFSRTTGVWVWIDPKAGRLIIDSINASDTDSIVTSLVEMIEGFVPRLVQTRQSPAAAMATWLHDHVAPANFCLGSECELKALDETRASVRYARHTLETAEIIQHIASGKRPTRVELAHKSGLSFVLTDKLHLRKVSTDVELIHQKNASVEERKDALDTDFTIKSAAICETVADLLAELGEEE